MTITKQGLILKAFKDSEKCTLTLDLKATES